MITDYVPVSARAWEGIYPGRSRKCRTEEGTDAERLVHFSDAEFASGISFFSTAAGYSVLLLFFVRPITNLHARRWLS